MIPSLGNFILTIRGCSSFSAAAAKSLQLCPTLSDPIDGTPSGSSVPGILPARIWECVAISFSNARMHAKSLQLCPTLCDPMETAHQAPLSTEFFRQEWVAISSPIDFYKLLVYFWN